VPNHLSVGLLLVGMALEFAGKCGARSQATSGTRKQNITSFLHFQFLSAAWHQLSNLAAWSSKLSVKL
jgi:hypothetical protein